MSLATGVTVRPATADDVPAVLAIWEHARSAAARTADTPDATTRMVELGWLLVAESGEGELVGTLIAASDGWRGNMYRLAVLPSHRRRGIARLLVERGEEGLRAAGATRVTALLGAEDDTAAGLWRAVGYAYDDNVVRYVRDL